MAAFGASLAVAFLLLIKRFMMACYLNPRGRSQKLFINGAMVGHGIMQVDMQMNVQETLILMYFLEEKPSSFRRRSAFL